MTRRVQSRAVVRIALAFAVVRVSVPVLADVTLSDELSLRGGARAYWSSAYISSSGNWIYDAPVLEQYLDLTLDAGVYGSLRTDAWIFSDVSGTCQDVHRRAFSCYEGTVTYGYDYAFDEERTIRLCTNGGVLWDWLGGYEAPHDTPIYYYAFQSLENPVLTPYWNFLGGPWTGGDVWNRARFGARHAFQVFNCLTLTPYADATWGDPTRFRKNYGESPDSRILGGSVMFGMIGVVVQWRFTDHWFLWGRYRQYFTIDGQARRLIRDRADGPNSTEYPFFSLGLGCRL